jgi:arginine exporter protein ArgO
MKIIFFIIALLTALAICGIGVAIGEKSWLIAIISIVSVFFLMGYGFSLKKKQRERSS